MNDNQQKIYDKFLGANLKIISYKKLEEYIKFCTRNNVGSRERGKSSLHHILPQAENLPFEEYSNLRNNPWNGSHLSYANHYIAHSLLALSINHPSILIAWYYMNNFDFKLGRIEAPKTLIGSTQYQILMEANSLRISNINKSKSHIDSRQKTMLIIGEDGLNGYQRNGIKISKALKGKKWTPEQRKSGEKRPKGKKHHLAKKIHIYNSFGELMYETHGDFLHIILTNNLPLALGDSYRNGGQPIYENSGNSEISRLKNNGNIQYKGWYAKVI